MTTSYETIPQEEEPKKQNGGRKVAGALLAFALAAGLMASVAGRNRGATFTAVAFKDDRTFAYGDDAGALYIANLGVAVPPSKFDTRRPGINELAYSKDGTLAVAAGPGTAGEVFLFD